ncbi:PREDICTED: cell death specification protein 2-like [Amphimedon queenslandica]|uniref:BZIP domain-containing protein n=1 Tax=Amphimedon queenslandica TaxID=400682 RepID=A0A1X7VC21_AMPQE|nr:PREDICTED: cell death specification protein 2-like [Amphimedon queenslandica]|eukprot:XP_003384889.1 PREDICTED: cell death specification protein 2-like [Amphimedon queenslandica]
MDDSSSKNLCVGSNGLFLNGQEDLGLFASFQHQWSNMAGGASSSSSLAAMAGLQNDKSLGTTGSSSSPEDASFLNSHAMISAVDSNRSSAISDHTDTEDYEDDRPKRKRPRNPIPNEKKDDKYWERRRKNNIAAKRSRETKKQKVDEELLKAKDAIQENHKLKQEIEVLKAEINSLRRLLKDANMTLSLWIRAKQTSEPASQLPPMLRNTTGNMPFVTFPVTTSNL